MNLIRNFVLFFVLFLSLSLQSQMWVEQDGQLLRTLSGTREITPDQYRTFRLDTNRMGDLLRQLPQENALTIRQSPVLMQVPLPDGRLESFRVVSYQMMEPALASRYPDYFTVRGISTEDPQRRLRMDWTMRGFRGMITGPDGRIFIDPVFREDKTWYQSYHKSAFRETEPFTCSVNAAAEDRGVQPTGRSGDCTFRSYRLVVATTGEYSNYFGADTVTDESIVLSEVITAVNRVNDVYEADVAVRMILIAETVDVFFYDGETDPYTNGNGGTMLGQNISTCNDSIGAANYDIGHVFSTGGGGVAYLGVPCGSNKAGGVTGQNNPVNDPFYIDYVAHEMGHQFGANHTQNNNCNRVLTASMEPGSASTIMGYAGICSPNVQPNSDAYFHGISVQEINNYITSGNGNSCDVPLPFSNSAPSVTPQGDYTIPAGTPFMLTADATDADGDPLFYCWEQWDPEPGPMPPQSTNTEGPMFRTFFPEPSPTRYFPRLSDLVTNNDFPWEELPSVSRDMEFRVTIRDDVNGVGCTTEENLFVTTDASAGPFVVTSPDSNVTWMELEDVTIEWDVANTDQGPVSCSSVDILLSRDGGFTYPDTLALDTPNDGAHAVTVPPGVTGQARILVKCSTNIFFDISDHDITILPGIPGYLFNSTDTIREVCAENAVSFNIDVTSIAGYNESVDIAINFLPPNSGVNINPNPVVPGNPVTIELTNLQAVSEGSYLMELEGSSASGVETLGLKLEKPPAPLAPALISPADGALDVPFNPVFKWTPLANANEYALQVHTDPSFHDPVILDQIVDDSLQSADLNLDQFTTYYWRVRGINNCYEGPWSDAYSFTTKSCFQGQSDDTPISISPNGPDEINSYVQVSQAGIITDVNVSLDILHTYTGDLEIRVTSPGGQTIFLVDRICGSNDNILLTLDSDAPPGNIPCPPTDGNAYQPKETLSTLIGEDPAGTWELEVRDRANQDGGSLESWTLEVCIASTCQLNVDTKTGNLSGSLAAALTCAASTDTIVFDPALAGDTVFLASTHILGKDLYLKNENNQTVYISTEQPERIFEVKNSGVLGLENVTLLGKGIAEGSAILNQGILQLSGADIRKFTDAADPVLLNQGQLQVKGSCMIDQSQ